MRLILNSSWWKTLAIPNLISTIKQIGRRGDSPMLRSILREKGRGSSPSLPLPLSIHSRTISDHHFMLASSLSSIHTLPICNSPFLLCVLINPCVTQVVYQAKHMGIIPVHRKVEHLFWTFRERKCRKPRKMYFSHRKLPKFAKKINLKKKRLETSLFFSTSLFL